MVVGITAVLAVIQRTASSLLRRYARGEPRQGYTKLRLRLEDGVLMAERLRKGGFHRMVTDIDCAPFRHY